MPEGLQTAENGRATVTAWGIFGRDIQKIEIFLPWYPKKRDFPSRFSSIVIALGRP
jgi:hypothetical protein